MSSICGDSPSLNWRPGVRSVTNFIREDDFDFRALFQPNYTSKTISKSMFSSSYLFPSRGGNLKRNVYIDSVTFTENNIISISVHPLSSFEEDNVPGSQTCDLLLPEHILEPLNPFDITDFFDRDRFSSKNILHSFVPARVRMKSLLSTLKNETQNRELYRKPVCKRWILREIYDMNVVPQRLLGYWDYIHNKDYETGEDIFEASKTLSFYGSLCRFLGPNRKPTYTSLILALLFCRYEDGLEHYKHKPFSLRIYFFFVQRMFISDALDLPKEDLFMSFCKWVAGQICDTCFISNLITSFNILPYMDDPKSDIIRIHSLHFVITPHHSFNDQLAIRAFHLFFENASHIQIERLSISLRINGIDGGLLSGNAAMNACILFEILFHDIKTRLHEDKGFINKEKSFRDDDRDVLKDYLNYYFGNLGHNMMKYLATSKIPSHWFPQKQPTFTDATSLYESILQSMMIESPASW